MSTGAGTENWTDGFVAKQIIYKGAEATISLGTWHGFRVVRKWRAPKRYRIEELDQALRTTRTVHEAQLLHDSKEAGVPAPTVLLLSPKDATLLLSYIEGERLRETLASVSAEERTAECRSVGSIVGRLHAAGIVHGDLTTSNMILAGDGRVFLIDFGLGSYSCESEDMGVDLLLMKRALNSAHYRIADECFRAFLEGYHKELGGERASKNLRKVREIERRGRYVDRTVRRAASSPGPQTSESVAVRPVFIATDPAWPLAKLRFLRSQDRNQTSFR